MPDPEQPDAPGGDRFSHESALWRTERQNDRVREIHTRLGVVISADSLIIGLFALALAAWVREPGAAVQTLSVIVLVIFTIGIIGAFIALNESLSTPNAELDEIRDIERQFGEAAARKLVLQSMIEAYQANRPIIARMERWLRVSLAATAANAILAPATIIAALLL